MERVIMGKTTKKTKSKQEPKDDINTAELKGDNVEVVDDYSRFIALEEDPLKVEDADGVDLEESKPDWHFAWIRNGKEKDAGIRDSDRLRYCCTRPGSGREEKGGR
jgi:hypothetical protein